MNDSGTRINVTKEDGVEVVIHAARESGKQKMLLFWIIAWTACGLYIISQLLSDQQETLKTYLIVWMGFWVYFEYKAIHAFRWRTSGKEVIELGDERLFISRKMAGRGIRQPYSIDFIKNLALITAKPNNFFNFMNSSYWVVSGEKIGFDYQGKKVLFGLELEDKEAASLCSMLKHEIQQRKKG